MLFIERPFLDRFEAAARAGFDAVECQFPYAHPAHEIRARLDANGLQLVLHNLPAGNLEAGERGIACHPGRQAEFDAGVRHAVEYAQALGVPQLNCLAGIAPPGQAESELRATFVANLQRAAAVFQQAGLKLLIEPINTFDVPAFFLNRTAQAAAIVQAVGAPNLFIQYDLYHAQRMEGDLAATLAWQLPRIGHIQLADNPGRHEPGSGEINFSFLFAHIDRIGYGGWVGCEYAPAADTESGLAWRGRLLP